MKMIYSVPEIKISYFELEAVATTLSTAKTAEAKAMAAIAGEAGGNTTYTAILEWRK